MSQSTDQPDMFPELVPDIAPPPIALRYWKAVRRHFEAGAVDPPTRKQVVDKMVLNNPDLAASLSTVDRACSDHPDLCPKPKTIQRWMRPPWERAQDESCVPIRRVLLDCTDEATGLHTQIQAMVDGNGILRLVNRLSAAAIVGFGSWVILDGMDGHFDGIIRWCQTLSQMHHLIL